MSDWRLLFTEADPDPLVQFDTFVYRSKIRATIAEQLIGVLDDAMFAGALVHPPDQLHASVRFASLILFDVDIDEEMLSTVDLGDIEFGMEQVDDFIHEFQAIQKPAAALVDIYQTVMRTLEFAAMHHT